MPRRRLLGKHAAGLSIAAAAMASLLLVHASAWAQPDSHRARGNFSGEHESAIIKELLKRLDQRDDEIRTLMERTGRLERLYRHDHAALAKVESRLRGSNKPRAAKFAARPTTTASADSGPQVARNAGSATMSPAAPSGNGKGASSAKGPGQFEVSPEAAQHALERALVQTGALLLRPGKFEFVPSETVQLNHVSRPDQVVRTSTGALLVTQDMQRSTLLETQALLRVGLPWDSQIEFSTSFDHTSLTTNERISGGFLGSSSINGSGLGDSSITVIKQIHKEGDWLPGLFISGTGNIGQQNHGLALGSGYDWLRGSITAVKRQDPLVFTAGFSYQTDFSYHGLEPGDQYTPSLGMLFAISPETSLQFGQQVTFAKDLKLRGATVPGSSQVEAAFQAGVLSILAPGLVVDLSAAVGETPDAPDLTVQFALPIRLN